MNTQASTTKQEYGMVTGLFRDRESSENAYRVLRERGYTDDEINVIMSDKTRDKYYGTGTKDLGMGSKALEGTGVGGAVGATLGAIAGGLAAVGSSIVVPGLGLVIAGPIVAALAGAGAGAVTGGLVGAFIGWGIPEDRAKVYETGIKEGGIVLGVKPRTAEDAEFFETEFRDRYHGEHVYR